MIPGFVQAGGLSPRFLRIAIWGGAKSGKTVFCSTFPAPLFVHPIAESGYDTFCQTDGHLLFPVSIVGQTHIQWINNRSGRKITEELEALVNDAYQTLQTGNYPYQTLVIGGFSDIQQAVFLEATQLERDSQRQWGYVTTWGGKFLAQLMSLPLHVIIEVSAATKRKNRTGTVISLKPDLAGKTENLLLNKANLILFQESVGPRYLTHFKRVMRADKEEKENGIVEYALAESRLLNLSFSEPVMDCCYDVIAAKLGLSPLSRTDPNHPRCKPGVWPWPHPHAQ